MKKNAQLDLSRVAKARRALGDLDAQQRARFVEARQLREARERLTRTGGPPSEVERLNLRLHGLAREREQLSAELRKRLQDALREREQLVATLSEEESVRTLSGRSPVALLPVRLETRFFDDGNELRVRIYPDQIHLDQHDPALTADEQAATTYYHHERTAGGSDLTRARAAWAELVRRFGAARAAYLVEAGKPGSLPEERATSWSRASVARALPDRFLIVGYRDGAEHFRKWGRAVPERLTVSLTPEPEAAPDPVGEPPSELPLPDELRWIADFAEAQAQGMAVTIRQGDIAAGRPALRHGVDRLVVIGVDWTLGPDEAAKELGRLLEAHRYSDGLAIVPQGTATNNSDAGAVPSGASPAELDPLIEPAETRALDLLVQGLGLPANAALRSVAGGSCTEADTVEHLLSALWPSTLGYYLSTMLAPLVDAATQERVRQHAIAFLRPSGPYSVLRIGKQPYGVLPVLARGTKGASDFEQELIQLLERARGPWSSVVHRVPRVSDGPGPDDPAGSLETRIKKVLERSPVAEVLRFRRVLSETTVRNSTVPTDVADVQRRLLALLHRHFAWQRSPYFATLTLEGDHYALPVPFVQATVPGPERLSPNYLEEIATLTRQVRGRDLLLERLSNLAPGDTLLQCLLELSAVNAIDAATLGVLAPQIETRHALVQESLSLGRFPVVEAVGLQQRIKAPDDAVAVASPSEASQVVLPSLDSKRPVAELVVLALSSSKVADRLPKASLEALQRLVADLDALKSRRSDELDWAFRAVLDGVSYRLDAWLTSLATRRLADVRAQSPNAGTHLGAYGWVEDLRPNPASETSQGYVLAPSLPHAATAAVLRSGYLTHAGSTRAMLEVDLSSERVALALPLIEGVSRGQPLAALLGYRLERGLRERDLSLARFILPIRSVAPLREARPGTAAPLEPSEAISARDVCDGVALVERWRTDRAGLLSAIAAAATRTPTDAATISALMPGVATELGVLDNLLDAVSDVLVSESVYQTVLGNPERAGAALGVLDRQMRPIEPQVVDTPRSGHAYTQRVGVLTCEALPTLGGLPPADPVLAAWAPLSHDVRATVEPRLNAWLARQLGAPERYRFVAELVTSDETGVETRAPLPPLGLEALQLSPLALLAASAPGARGGPSELQQRVVQRLLAGVPALAADAVVELGTSPPLGEPDAVGLSALEALLGMLRKLLGTSRPFDARDFAPPETSPDARRQVAELGVRVDGCVARLRAAATPLATALAAAEPSAGAVHAALVALSAAGFANAFPALLDPSGLAPDSEPILRLLGQAHDVNAACQGSLGRVDAQQQAWSIRPDKTPGAEVEYQLGRAKELLGKDFLLLPLFDVTNGAELSASLGDQASLRANEPFSLTHWVERLALVRPALDRFASVVTAAGLLGNVPDDANLRVLQLPHAPGARWLALPQDGKPPAAQLALVLQTFGPLDLAPGAGLAGFYCDDWSEAIPVAAETVAATFQFDAPGSRPPQALLLAVPETLEQESWSSDQLLRVVNEALDLAKLRLVGPAELDLHGLLLPTTFLPETLTREFPSLSLIKLKDTVTQIARLETAKKNSTWTSS